MEFWIEVIELSKSIIQSVAYLLSEEMYLRKGILIVRLQFPEDKIPREKLWYGKSHIVPLSKTAHATFLFSPFHSIFFPQFKYRPIYT